MRIYEKYRPSDLAEVAGQPEAVTAISRLLARGIGGNALWISGESGTGKTTLARIVAASVADPFCVDEMDGTDMTPARIRDCESKSHLYGWGKGGWAFVANEAHGLRSDAVRQLLTVLERTHHHTVWVFTTTTKGQKLIMDGIDGGPLLSRCVHIPLHTRAECLDAFAERARVVAMSEGIDGQPLSFYQQLVRAHDGNLRAVYESMETWPLDQSPA